MILNTAWLALREIRRHLLRSALTMLGIVIGVSAVITMVTLGQGATRSVQDQIASLGTNLLMVRPGQRLGPGSAPGSASPAFVESDLDAIDSQLGGVQAVAPEVRSSVTVIANGRNWQTVVTGSTNHYFVTGNWKLASGRGFEDGEQRSGAAVCLIGATLQRELFGGRVPLGEQVRVKTFSCSVIGVLASKGQAAMGQDQDDLLLLPLRTMQRRVAGNLRIGTILVSLQSGSDPDRVNASLRDLLRERRKLTAADDDNFNILDTRQLAETLTGTTRVLTGLLGAVAAVSLLVGGIGIMNIMLVSVTERTREIGVRLAIGALAHQVLLQFLIEAVVLSALGGLIGIVLAAAMSIGLAQAMHVPYLFNPTINLLAFAFSAVIGVLFGYVPARRAAQLDPIEALRHE